MKLKEKLAYHAAEGENSNEAFYYRSGFVDGFEKAREMCNQRINDYSKIDYIENLPDNYLTDTGEEET